LALSSSSVTFALGGASDMNIPTLPSPPTDNLYKFMALSGVVLLMVAPFFWAKFYITHAEQTRMAFETLFESIPPYDYYISKGKVERGESVTEDQKKLVEKFDALRKESGRAGSEFLLYDRFSYVVTGAAIFLGLLGVALTWFGFLLWYRRVQKPLDRILMKEIKKANESSG
jgi:hypothetical protein